MGAHNAPANEAIAQTALSRAQAWLWAIGVGGTLIADYRGTQARWTRG